MDKRTRRQAQADQADQADQAQAVPTIILGEPVQADQADQAAVQTSGLADQAAQTLAAILQAQAVAVAEAKDRKRQAFDQAAVALAATKTANKVNGRGKDKVEIDEVILVKVDGLLRTFVEGDWTRRLQLGRDLLKATAAVGNVDAYVSAAIAREGEDKTAKAQRKVLGRASVFGYIAAARTFTDERQAEAAYLSIGWSNMVAFAQSKEGLQDKGWRTADILAEGAGMAARDFAAMLKVLRAATSSEIGVAEALRQAEAAEKAAEKERETATEKAQDATAAQADVMDTVDRLVAFASRQEQLPHAVEAVANLQAVAQATETAEGLRRQVTQLRTELDKVAAELANLREAHKVATDFANEVKANLGAVISKKTNGELVFVQAQAQAVAVA